MRPLADPYRGHFHRCVAGGVSKNPRRRAADAALISLSFWRPAARSEPQDRETDQWITSGPAARTAALRGRIHGCTRTLRATSNSFPLHRGRRPYMPKSRSAAVPLCAFPYSEAREVLSSETASVHHAARWRAGSHSASENACDEQKRVSEKTPRPSRLSMNSIQISRRHALPVLCRIDRRRSCS